MAGDQGTRQYHHLRDLQLRRGLLFSPADAQQGVRQSQKIRRCLTVSTFWTFWTFWTYCEKDLCRHPISLEPFVRKGSGKEPFQAVPLARKAELAIDGLRDCWGSVGRGGCRRNRIDSLPPNCSLLEQRRRFGSRTLWVRSKGLSVAVNQSDLSVDGVLNLISQIWNATTAWILRESSRTRSGHLIVC